VDGSGGRGREDDEDDEGGSSSFKTSAIAAQFRSLKRELAAVSEVEWDRIPETSKGDASLRRRRLPGAVCARPRARLSSARHRCRRHRSPGSPATRFRMRRRVRSAARPPARPRTRRQVADSWAARLLFEARRAGPSVHLQNETN
jgi:hypothetical protein